MRHTEPPRRALPHRLLRPLAAASCALALAACASTDEAREVWTGALDEATFAALHEHTDAQAPPALGREVTLADGSRAYLARAAQDGAPALIVIHEWWGLNDHVRHWTDRLAAAGYDALAVDLYGGVVATDREAAMNAMRAVDDDAARATLRAAAAYVQDELGAPRYGSIGWCFGGGWSLRTALDQPELDACVVFYGRLETDPQVLAAVRAPILGVFGTRDASIPNEVVDAFEAAAVAAGVPEVAVARYDAEHAFANPSSARYDADAAGAAWQVVQAFLAQHLR